MYWDSVRSIACLRLIDRLHAPAFERLSDRQTEACNGFHVSLTTSATYVYFIGADLFHAADAVWAGFLKAPLYSHHLSVAASH